MSDQEDTAKIQSIVNDILKEHSAVTPISEQIARCFDTAYANRKGKSKDIILAAVEHYFFARRHVAQGGRVSYALMVTKVFSYEAVKFNPLSRWGLEKLNKLLDDPDPTVSPASTHSIGWGIRGANHGLTDYDSMHPIDPFEPVPGGS